jgi:hypothetical protein
MIRALFALSLLPVVTPIAQAQDKPAPEVSFSGTVLMNGFYTSDKTNNNDLPQFAVPRDASDSFPTGGVGATLRQTRVQARAFAAGVLGGDFTALVDVDFFGGQQPSNGGRTFPLLRIRRAWARMNWDRFRVMAGQEAPPIAELNPSSLASIGLSSFSSSGNLWLWIPQIRATGDLNGGNGARVYVEGAILAPTGYTAQGPFLTQPDRAEQSKRPYLQSRIGVRWGGGGAPGELSVGGHLGWISSTGDSLLDSRAVAVMLQVPLGRVLELRGEAFTGKAIAGLGGGAIGQNLGLNGVPVRTRGGWAQLLVKPSPEWELGGGYGIDDPQDADLNTATMRLKNQTVEGHIHWRPSPLILGLEYHHITTTYASGNATAGHLNLALGAEF